MAGVCVTCLCVEVEVVEGWKGGESVTHSKGKSQVVCFLTYVYLGVTILTQIAIDMVGGCITS